MEIKWMKTFISSAEYENFRKASEELFLSQPAVTKHIKLLEKHLNTQLFERMGKTVVLTSAGYKFLPYAKEIIAKYEQGIVDFEAWKQGYQRKLIIAAAPQIASSLLPSLLRNFIDKNPDIEVIINVLKSYEIGEEVSAGRADLGLTRIQPLQTNIKSEIVHEDPVILVGPNVDTDENYLDEKMALYQYRLITHNHPNYWDQLLNDIKKEYPTIRTMKVDQVEVTKRFIEEGLGVSYLPLTMIKDEVRTNKLVEIKPNRVAPPKSTTYLLTKVETDEIIIFTNFLKEAISEF